MVSSDRAQTEQKIIDAVGKIVLREGINKLGINAVAKEANVDKNLIYRYFGGFQGLLKKYIVQQDFFLNIKIFTDIKINALSPEQIPDLLKKMFLMQLSYVRENKELQEIFLWELVHKDEVSEFIADERERSGQELLKIIKEKTKDTDADIEALGTILICGINQIVLRARTVNEFNGLDLTSEDSWRRLEDSIEYLIDLIKFK